MSTVLTTDRTLASEEMVSAFHASRTKPTITLDNICILHHMLCINCELKSLIHLFDEVARHLGAKGIRHLKMVKNL